MKSIVATVNTSLQPVHHMLEQYASPLLDLAIRLYMAKIFFVSGKAKFESLINEDWESTIFLFEEIHPVPGIDPGFAAASATAGELILPILLAIGLFSRFSALGLIIMTVVIQYIVPADYGLQNVQHYFWMFLLAVILTKGPGKLSVDRLLFSRNGR